MEMIGKYGVEKDLRKKVIACLKKYGGKLVEILMRKMPHHLIFIMKI